MRYVITGATSFIGLELTDFLLSKGDSVYAVCRSTSKRVRSIPQGATIVFAEMAEYGNLYKDISEADVFVNLAWEGTGHSGRDMIEIQQDNIAHTIAALHGAYRMKCKLFVEAGSQAEYGSTTETQIETMECCPFSEYGKAKLIVKEECFDQVEKMDGMKYIHLRIFSTYGENDHPWTLVMSCIDKMLRNEPMDLSSCTQNWNFVYSKDLTRIVEGLCRHAITDSTLKHEIYNVASNDTRPLKLFVDRIQELCKSTSVLNFGAVTPQNMVSLQPNIEKTKRHSGITSFALFDDVIRNIIQRNSI